MKIGDMCERDVITVHADDSLREAATRMRRDHVGDVVVIDDGDREGTPLGILTDRDIVVAIVGADVGLDEVAAGDAMSTDLVTATAEEELLPTLERMRERSVRRLPVVDDEGGLVGILSVDDVIGLLAKELAEVYALILRGRRRESDTRR